MDAHANARDTARMKELTARLSEAARAYYTEDREILSNLEYDALCDELAALERDTGIVLAGSPTRTVGYETASELPKEAHAAPLLSLDKTKDTEALRDRLGDKTGLLSWKLDGLTIALTYRGGELAKAVTRGNGRIGEVVTPNARAFSNLPVCIPYKGELVLRGEAVIGYADFERINAEIEDVSLRYKNPRNLCSGSVRQLNSYVTARRGVGFYAFALVSASEPTGAPDADVSVSARLSFLAGQGFAVVPYFPVTRDDVSARVAWFAERVRDFDLPSDGLVLVYDDVVYGTSLGSTSKFPRDSVAFKWEDEKAETTLLDIEWNTSRTGLVNPVAVFEPVEIEGSTVSRASVHNISIVEELCLGAGDRITVYKANMIIPQIAENLTRGGPVPIPAACPVCGGPARIRDEAGVRFLFCDADDCPAKHLKTLSHFVSRDAMNIEGLSEATLEKFVARGFVREAADLFRLARFRSEIAETEGFGERSCENLLAAAEKARTTTAARFLYSLGIPGVGLANAKLIARACDRDPARMRAAEADMLTAIDGVGAVTAEAFVSYFADADNRARADRLLAELRFEEDETDETGGALDGLVFVITGSLEGYPNRNALKNLIEARGGRVTAAVTANTDYLINNDPLSGSSKNKKARELGIAILDETGFTSLLAEKTGAEA